MSATPNPAFEELLEHSGIRPTAVRELIYTVLSTADEALSMTDIEDRLSTVDKSTVSRTLHLFQEGGIVHKIDDGTGISKYALSHHNSAGEALECQMHFYCNACEKTFCIENLPVPTLSLPKGFFVQDYSVVIRGLCPQCQRG